MNKIFKVIWNYATQSWVAVSELQKAKGKTKSLSLDSNVVRQSSPMLKFSLISSGLLLASGQVIAATGTDNTAAGQCYYDTTRKSVVCGDATTKVEGLGKNAVAIGVGAKANNSEAIAIGNNTTALVKGTAIGDSANSAPGGLAFGYEAKADYYSIAQGIDAQASDEQTIAIGQGTRATAYRSVAQGAFSEATGDYSISIGTAPNGGQTTEDDSGEWVDWGYSNDPNIASGRYAIAFGQANNVSGSNSTAIGQYNNLSGNSSIAFGHRTNVSGNQAIVIGQNTISHAVNTTVIGTNANVRSSTSGESIAIGTNATISGDGQGFAIAMGHSAKTEGINSMALGRSSSTAGQSSIAVGTFANASASYAIASGMNATASGENSVAIGHLATTTHDGSVAIGSNSTSAAANPTENSTLNNITYGKFAGINPESTVSVGAKDKERQVVNVAAGRISDTSTDAINGSQLYATNNVLGNLANAVKNIFGGNATLLPNGTITMTNVGDTGELTIHDAINSIKAAKSEEPQTYFHVNNGTNAGTGDATTNLGKVSEAAGALSLNSITAGVGAKTTGDGESAIAIGTNATSDSQSIALGNLANASSGLSIAIGHNSQATGDFSYAMGANSQASSQSSIALGQNSVASNVISIAIGDSAASTGEYALAFGSGANASKTAGIAIGASAQASHDFSVALGGEAATGEVIGTNSAEVNGITYSGFAGNTPFSTVSVGNEEYEQTRTITNVAAGRINKDSTDAINGSQLYMVADKLSAGFTLKHSATADGEENGIAEEQIKPADTVEMIAGKNLQITQEANGKITYATKDNVTFTTVNATTVNVGDTTINNDGLTIKNGPSITTGGVNAGDKKITNVADGDISENSTDAVNGSQLYAVKQDVANNTNAINNLTTNVGTLANNTIKLGGNTGTTDAQALNQAGGLQFNVKGDNGLTTTANGANITVTIEQSNITQNANGTVSAETKGNTYATAEQVANAINQSGFTLKTSATDGEKVSGDAELINPGDTVEMVAGKNLQVTQEANGKITYATKDNVTFTSVNATTVNVGDTTINNDGLTIKNGPSITKDGLNAGNKVISNVSAGIADNDAVNVGQLKEATSNINSNINNLANNTITLGGDNGTTTSAQTLNKEGGLRFDVNGGNGISTTANGSSITVTAKTDGTTIKIDASGNIAANTGNVTIASNVDTTDAAGNVIPAGKVSVAAGEGSKVATVQNVADAINSAGWVVNTGKAIDQNSFDTAAVNHQPTKVSAGSKVNFQAGKNMEVKRDGENIIYATSDNVSFNTVTVGNTKITNDGVSIVNGPSMTKDGIDAGGKRITNVAPGRPGTTDAVNMQQLRDATTNINNQLNKMDKRRKAGHASGLAVAGLMQAYREGQSAVTAGVGQYQNQSAVAVGYSRIADSGKYGVKAAFTANTQGEVGGTLSAGYFW